MLLFGEEWDGGCGCGICNPLLVLGKGLCRREKGGGRQLPAGLTGVGVGVSGGGTCSPLLLFFWYSGRGEGLFHCSEKLLQDILSLSSLVPNID